MNHTQESITKLLENHKRKIERINLLERERKKREKEKLRKAKKLMKQTLEKINKLEEDKKRKKQDEIERRKLFSFTLFHIYSNRFVERDSDEDDLYNTRQELMEAEKRGEGAINWDVWQRVVNEYKANGKKDLY